MRWLALLTITSFAVAEQTCTLGSLFLSDVASSNVRAIDIDTGAETTIDGAGFSANPYIYASSAASHVFLNHRSENGVVRIVDAGFAFESHGDHYAISKKAPAVLPVKVEGDMPTHVTPGHGQTTIFFDGRRESYSSVIAFDDTSGKLLGAEVVTTFTYGPMDPQHGNAGAMANSMYFVSAPNPGYKTLDSESSLSLGVWVVDQQGNTVYDANVAGDADRSCPAYHGHGEHGEYHVFGCGDGILVLHQDTATNTISSRKIPYHDTGRRTGSFFSHHQNPVIVAQHSRPFALIRWRAGPADYEPRRDVLEFPEAVQVCGAAFELVHGAAFLVLVSNGTLLAYHVSDAWTPIASLPAVLPEFSCGGHDSNYPRLVAGYNRVFVTVPERNLVKEIKVGATNLELGREFSVSFEPGFAAVAGLSAAQAEVAACSDEEDSEEGHDHGHDHEHGPCGVAWIGATDLTKGIYTVVLSKVDGEYPASSIAMLVRKVGRNYRDELESLQVEADAVLACHDHRRAGHTEASGTQGSQLSLAGDQTLLSLDMDTTAVATLLTLDVPDDGTYLFFASHAPYEFQDATAWLLSPDGEAAEFDDLVGGAECKSELTSSEVWGYSFLGTLLCALVSLVGVLFLVPALQTRREQIISYLHSFAAGVLLALVVVHLIPEALALADKAWKVSACIMAGFVAGLLIEHGLRIFGKGHTHHPQPNGKAQHSSLPASTGPDAPVAAVQASSSEQTSRSLVVTGQPIVVPLRHAALPPSSTSSAQPQASTSFMMQPMIRQYPPPAAAQGQPFVSPSPGMLPVHMHGVNFGQLAFRGDGSAQPPQSPAVDGAAGVGSLPETNPRTAMATGSALGLHSPEEFEGMEEGHGSLSGKATEVLPNAWALAMNVVIGDLFHNFFDGVIIATGFRVCGHQMGWTLTAGAIVHEIPQELSDFIILVESGLSWQMALCLNFVSSLSAIFGAFVLLGIDEITVDVDHTMGILLGMGAGLMLYIATSLIPGIVAVEDFSKARLCWLMFAVGACCIGILQLWHDHCHCEENAPPGVDPHAGHNH